MLKADEKMYSNFCKMAAELLAPVAASVGWEPQDTDGHSGKLLRATIIELLATWVHVRRACRYGGLGGVGREGGKWNVERRLACISWVGNESRISRESAVRGWEVWFGWLVELILPL